MKNCEHCGKEFEPISPEQKYCKSRHQRNAHVKRSRKRRGLLKDKCWTPWKLAFDDEDSAYTFIEKRGYTDSEVYSCACDNFHIRTKK